LTTNLHTAAHIGALDWFLDSGATMHCTPNEEDLIDVQEITPISIRGVSRQRIHAAQVGTLVFRLPKGWRLAVKGILLILDAALQLLSIGRLANIGLDLRFSRSHTVIIWSDYEKNIASATRVGRGLYALDLAASVKQAFAASSAPVPMCVWHASLGHLSTDHVQCLARSGAVEGMHVDLYEHPPACKPCIRRKLSRPGPGTVWACM
jgi:hypothetical protein